MSAGRCVLLAVWTGIVLCAVLVALSNRGATCEERGGEMVFSGFMTINNMVGKVMVPTLVPQYRCEGVKR